jgi:hypothetical protein
MRPDRHSQAAAAEHPARPGGNGDQIKGVQAARIDGQR